MVEKKNKKFKFLGNAFSSDNNEIESSKTSNNIVKVLVFIKNKLPGFLLYLFLTLWALTTIFPLIWTFMNSFKTKKEIYEHSLSIPLGKYFTLDNYKHIFETQNIFGAYRNSLIISAVVAVVVIIIAGMAAYVLARYNFPLKNVLMALLYSGMMFPIFATIIPVFTMFQNISTSISTPINDFVMKYIFDSSFMGEVARFCYNNSLNSIGDTLTFKIICVILIQIAGNMSFAIIVLSSYIEGLPIELEEAAYMEGCNIYQIFGRVILPLCKPSFITVGIFSFLWSYNDLFTQMFFLRSGDHRTITYLLNCISSQEGTNYGAMFASVSLIIIPVLVVYIALQKYIIEGMTVGAVKG